MEHTAAPTSRTAAKPRRARIAAPVAADAPKSIQRRAGKAAPVTAPAPAPAAPKATAAKASAPKVAATPAPVAPKPALTVVPTKTVQKGPEVGIARPRHADRAILDRDVSKLPSGSERDNLGKRLFWARNNLDPAPTQAAAADVVRISRGAYAQWESGLTTPPIDKIEILAKWFQCDPAWLAFGTPPDQLAQSGMTAAPGIRYENGSPKATMIFGIPGKILDQQSVVHVQNIRVVEVAYADKALGLARGDQVYVDTGHQKAKVPGAYAYRAGIDLISVCDHNDLPKDVDIVGRVFGLAWREI